MASIGTPLLTSLLILLCLIGGSESATNSSSSNTTKKAEKALFDNLFATYDKRVRPVDEPTESVQLWFGVKLSKVVKMDSKEQQLTTSVWVTQIWRDPNLKWNKIAAQGVDKIFVEPSEIWTPDIALYNNADESLSVAGHEKKFQTRIMVDHKGTCRWMSPATFKSTCSIKIRYWPFDLQKCFVTFGSYTMDVNMLNLTVLTQKSKFSDRFVTSGDWDIKDINTKRAESRQSCCPAKFSTVTFEIFLKRKPLYHMLYIIAPCTILLVLTLLSFAIPSQSGERIGFITTILLAMTVYLLLVQETLPETSEELPLVGLFFIVAIAETALVLLATILVLRCFHKEGEPPVWLQRFFTCGSCKKQGRKRKMSSKKDDMYMNGMEMGSEKIATDIVSVFSKYKTDGADHGISWQDISVRLNGIFFFICVAIVAVTYGVIYSNAASITDV